MEIVGHFCPVTILRYTNSLINVISGVTAPTFTKFLVIISSTSCMPTIGEWQPRPGLADAAAAAAAAA